MATKDSTGTEVQAAALQCGIVMPISTIDGCTSDHWAEVKAIIQDAVESIGTPKFSARLVSDADDVGVIQKRIIQGVYSSEVVVCDVSGKNPNVMFELGMRLAFDKPTVIVKDDKTDYAFDTGVIEHITYPRDLRFQRMVEFKQVLAQKVLATYNAAQNDPEHSTFLKNFGTFKVAHLREKEASAEQVILDAITDLQREVTAMRRGAAGVSGLPSNITHGLFETGGVVTMEAIEAYLERADNLSGYPTIDAWNEVKAMRPTLERIRELPNLPPRLVTKIDRLLKEQGNLKERLNRSRHPPPPPTVVG